MAKLYSLGVVIVGGHVPAGSPLLRFPAHFNDALSAFCGRVKLKEEEQAMEQANLLTISDKCHDLCTKMAFFAGVIEAMSEAKGRGVDMEEEALFGMAAFARQVHEDAVTLSNEILRHKKEAIA